MGTRVPLVSLRSLLVFSACVLGAPSALDAQLTPSATSEQLAELVNTTLGLESSALFRLEVDGEPGAPIQATVPLHGVPFTLVLAPHSTRSATDYRVLVQVADGSLVETAPSPVRTLRGSVLGIPGSAVAATFDEGRGLYARIRLDDDGEEFWVEQLAPRMAGVDEDLHVVYGGDAVMSAAGQCGTTALPTIEVDHTHGGQQAGSAPACGVGLCLAQLGIDADFEYYQANGSSVTNVENKVNAVINAMNLQYESQVDIRHDITTIVVRTSEPDPYDSTTINGLLSQLRSEWQGPLSGTPHDTAQLFTGTSLSGSVIGIAWLSGVCGSLRYSVVENFSSSFACTTDLSAHELGHNWSAPHCSCPGNTMNPSITCANDFSAGTISTISNFRDGLNCLNSGGPPTADFTADQVTGGFPFKVRFSDASNGAYTDWLWDFGDGGSSTAQDPAHTYAAKGSYDVSLTVSGPAGSDTLTKTGFIQVTDQVVDFTDLGGGTPWAFGTIVPSLEASTTFVVGEPFDLFLGSAPGSTVALAWVSFASTPLNALGGTVWANPPSQQLFFTTTFLGGLSLTVPWPAGVPSGTELYIQFLCASAGAQDGITLSNGITATVP